LLSWSSQDYLMMEMALALARSQLGRTAENPSVGCVIVRGEEILSTGVTGDGGRPHGEEAAISNAKGNLEGATVYVTLEPCAHHSSRGPTCAEGLIKAGITRLVACCQDPDPRTSGQGFALLKAAGIDVEVGLLAEQGLLNIESFRFALAMRHAGQP
jgi:diaminohydroxyphosphoribosylaminopyrimidine deaminase / 5-amino-6-(5-phosphoribosylamino)uracil reductase